jgi:calumenin
MKSFKNIGYNRLSTNYFFLLLTCRERDTDKDGKLDFKEFMAGMYENIKDLYQDHATSHDSSESRSKHLFMQLDLNHDG